VQKEIIGILEELVYFVLPDADRKKDGKNAVKADGIPPESR